MFRQIPIARIIIVLSLFSLFSLPFTYSQDLGGRIILYEDFWWEDSPQKTNYEFPAGTPIPEGIGALFFGDGLSSINYYSTGTQTYDVCELYNVQLFSDVYYTGSSWILPCGKFSAYNAPGYTYPPYAAFANDVIQSLNWPAKSHEETQSACEYFVGGQWAGAAPVMGFGTNCCDTQDAFFFSNVYGNAVCDATLSPKISFCDETGKVVNSEKLGSLMCNTDGSWIGCGPDETTAGNIALDGKFVCTKKDGLWSWKDAQTSANYFNILETGAEFDVISNGQYWYSCSIPGLAVPQNPFEAISLPRPEPGVYDASEGDNTGTGTQSETNNPQIEGNEIDEDSILAGVTLAVEEEQPEPEETTPEDEEASEDQINEDGVLYTPYEVNPERFLCHKKSGLNILNPVYGNILECCGPNYLFCNQPDGIVNARISGGPTNLLIDFYSLSPTNKNTVLRVNFPASLSNDRFVYAFTEIPISDWRNVYAAEIVPVPFYRLLGTNQALPSYGDHFYTISAEEKDSASAFGYTYERIEGYLSPIPQENTIPLYRLLGTNSGIVNYGDHFYTTSSVERDTTIANGWYSYEGIAGYIYETQRDSTVPLYRLWSTSIGDHFYTTDSAEAANAVASIGYVNEGVIGYVYQSLSAVPDLYVSYFEFDVIFAGSNKLKIAIYGGADEGIIFDDYIAPYSTTGDSLNKWHHIKIPLNLFTTRNPITKIEFYAVLEDFVGMTDFIELDGLRQFMVFGLDRLFLSNDDTETTQFCATDTEGYCPDDEFLQSGLCPVASNVGKWTADLDEDITGDACNNIASFKWSGTMCCGDDQDNILDIDETFNDRKAGCWKGEPVLFDRVSAAEPFAMFYNDTEGAIFRVCNIESSELDFTDVLEKTSCQNVGSWYCGFENLEWKNAFIYDSEKPINATKNILQLINDVESGYDTTLELPEYACCPESYCWNGNTCNATFTNPKTPPIYKSYGEEGYRCNSTGEWIKVGLKQDFNLVDDGYCNEETSCYAEVKCYKHTEWDVFDNVDRMCYNGAWTTRTKYVAASLINYMHDYENIVGSDYTLYCDVPEKALGLHGAELGTSPFTEMDYKVSELDFNDYMLESGFCGVDRCINNVCVLSFGDDVIIGTTLNKPISETEYPVYEAFGFEDGREDVDASGDRIEKLYDSANSGELFYSNLSQAMFYSTRNVLNFQAGFFEQTLHVLTDPITVVVNIIKNSITETRADTDVLTKLADFDKIYFNYKGSKSIIGVQETKYDEVVDEVRTSISIEYRGFTVDICTAVLRALPNSNCDDTTPGVIYISDSNENPETYDKFWQDLTSKLRIE